MWVKNGGAAMQRPPARYGELFEERRELRDEIVAMDPADAVGLVLMLQRLGVAGFGLRRRGSAPAKLSLDLDGLSGDELRAVRSCVSWSRCPRAGSGVLTRTPPPGT